jgi:quercetin dioxygenase-like cupin family protein
MGVHSDHPRRYSSLREESGRLVHHPVRIDPLFAAEPLSQAADTHVTFEPGTRTNSHTHLLGQALIVTFGRGWASARVRRSRRSTPAASSASPSDERHWYGASANRALSHIAV